MRLPLVIAENLQIKDEDRAFFDEMVPFTLGDREAYFDKREFYWILCVKGFSSTDSAQAFLATVALALTRLSISKRIAMRFDSFPAEIDRDSTNPFREKLRAELYGDWPVTNGTRTDGGVLPHITYVLPEHERIWEYPLLWTKASCPLGLADIRTELATAGQYRHAEGASKDECILSTMEVIWMAHEQRDPRLRFILLVTSLEILSKSEKAGQVSPEVAETISEIKKIIDARSKRGVDNPQEYDRLLRLADQMHDKGLTEKIRNLVFQGAGDRYPGGRAESNEAVNGIYKIRSQLTHGGKMRSSAVFREQLLNMLERLEDLVAMLVIRKVDAVAGKPAAAEPNAEP